MTAQGGPGKRSKPDSKSTTLWDLENLRKSGQGFSITQDKSEEPVPTAVCQKKEGSWGLIRVTAQCEKIFGWAKKP